MYILSDYDLKGILKYTQGVCTRKFINVLVNNIIIIASQS